MRNIVTCNTVGRYGRWANMLYQVAGVIGIARRNGFDFAFPLLINHDHKERFNSTEDCDVYKYLENPLPVYDGPTLPDYPVPWGYHEVNLTRSVSLSGHFQSERYFEHAIDEVKWYLRMKDEPALNHYVAVHVRRGDYDGGYHPRIPESYYREAMSLFPDCSFLIFSDDIPACKEMFGNEVEYSEGRNYLDDFKLMKSCQPSGTAVRTIDGDAPIETLEDGVRVVAYSSNAQVHKGITKLVGRGSYLRGAPPGRVVQRFSSRPFHGQLTIVTTESGRTSRYTPDHHCIVRIGDAFRQRYAVYLMRRGDQFRVGITGPQAHARSRKHARVIGFADVRCRLNSSQADEAWILTTFNNRDEALLEEAFICSAFGIPDVQFQGWQTSTEYLKRLTQFWERFGNNLGSAVKCLSYYGRVLRYPFCRRSERRDLTSDREIVIYACNLLDGMKILDADLYLARANGKGSCVEAWTTIRVTKELYTGSVFSMDVDVNHTYVGDGIVTHNCSKFIIANSSYSAMAAVLGEHPDKAVVAPRPWFGPAYAQITGEDIYGDGWKVIDWK